MRVYGEREGGWRHPFACVRALLRADSEAHHRCDARHAKLGRKVRALIRVQPSTVVDYELRDWRKGGLLRRLPPVPALVSARLSLRR